MRGPARGRAASFRGRPPAGDHSILSYCGRAAETARYGPRRAGRAPSKRAGGCAEPRRRVV